jgi:hypothetical protein
VGDERVVESLFLLNVLGWERKHKEINIYELVFAQPRIVYILDAR